MKIHEYFKNQIQLKILNKTQNFQWLQGVQWFVNYRL